MTLTAIVTGQLVRYRETTSRWYFALVHRVAKSGIQLRFFHGQSATVSSGDVESIDTFLDRRERAWSRTRAQLSEHFYGRQIQRLRPARFREMKRALNRAGISFTPEEWPTPDSRIRLWRDSSFVQDSTDPEMVALLPQWIEPFVLPSGSRDPLGLQAPAERLVNEVLPGLTVFTFRAGYYGFLCWAIRSVNGMASSALPRRMRRREVVNALERALVLCEFIYHGQDDDSCRLLGHRSKLRVLSSNKGELLTDRAATSSAQTTRLPGFFNHKRKPSSPVGIEYLRWRDVFCAADLPEVGAATPTRVATTTRRSVTASGPVERARAFLQHVDPAVSGRCGDLLTFRVCCRIVRGFDLSDDEAVCVLSEWNARCEPPWSERELRQKITNARRYGREPQGGLL